jgi:hypothetical protein
MDSSQINRFLSLPTSILLFHFSVKAIIFFHHLQKIAIHDVIEVIALSFFLLASVFLLLDFFCVKSLFVKKKIWLFFFLAGFAINTTF